MSVSLIEAVPGPERLDEPFEPQAPASTRGEPTWAVAHLFPLQGEWTEEEYFALETNRLVEFTDGELDFLPMPDIAHQVLVKWLVKQLDGYALPRRIGEAMFAPVPVRLRRGKCREPDVFLLSVERKVRRSYAEGADLVMEVVSRGRKNRECDVVEKRADYAEAGIREHWIIDPETSTIAVLTLIEREYQTHGEFRPGETATSALLVDFAINVKDCFDAASALK